MLLLLSLLFSFQGAVPFCLAAKVRSIAFTMDQPVEKCVPLRTAVPPDRPKGCYGLRPSHPLDSLTLETVPLRAALSGCRAAVSASLSPLSGCWETSVRECPVPSPLPSNIRFAFAVRGMRAPAVMVRAALPPCFVRCKRAFTRCTGRLPIFRYADRLC